MAVQILNDMPDAAVHRGEPALRPVTSSLSDWSPRATQGHSRGKRPLFVAVTVAVHLSGEGRASRTEDQDRTDGGADRVPASAGLACQRGHEGRSMHAVDDVLAVPV